MQEKATLISKPKFQGEVMMKAEKARIPITDFIKEWCELCRIRIDAREERTDVGGKTYHPDCYSTLVPPSQGR